MAKFYRCNHCGNILSSIKDSGVVPVCCGSPMTELIPDSVDAAFEKHVPVVEVTDSVVEIYVGEVAHPMIEAHYIEWIALETNHGICIKYLQPDDEEASHSFALAEFEKPVCAYAYCNLHGLWKKSIR